jgi:hypothetical protein
MDPNTGGSTKRIERLLRWLWWQRACIAHLLGGRLGSAGRPFLGALRSQPQHVRPSELTGPPLNLSLGYVRELLADLALEPAQERFASGRSQIADVMPAARDGGTDPTVENPLRGGKRHAVSVQPERPHFLD